MNRVIETSAAAAGAEGLPAAWTAFAEAFDGRLAEMLADDDLIPARLIESIRYSALAPGKRLRPFLLVRCCEAAGGRLEAAWIPAAAVECVHAFSLIHDDLPAMDDDDLRRGRLTNHRQFDEATAILAGDGLLAWAFKMLAAAPLDPGCVVRLVAELADATGPAGMIGGQMLDIQHQNTPPNLDVVRRIHELKTARLFESCAKMGAICADAPPGVEDALARYGRRLGLAFQIADDLLDETGATAEIGKRTGKDRVAGKQTYPSCIGEGPSRIEARRLSDSAVQALDGFGPEADDLRELARRIPMRRS